MQKKQNCNILKCKQKVPDGDLNISRSFLSNNVNQKQHTADHFVYIIEKHSKLLESNEIDSYFQE